MKRRNLLRLLGSGSAFAFSANALPSKLWGNSIEKDKYSPYSPLNGRIKQSVCSWTYGFLSLTDLCDLVHSIGITAIYLVAPKDFNILHEKNVHCSMCYSTGKISLTNGWNNPANHQQLIQQFKESIPLVAKAGFQNIICFSGNREGLDDETGLKNCITGLKEVLSLAEKNGVTIQMELFNSKVDHPDYMADNSAWGVALCKALDSPNFKLLYDIYHMQINEGDIIHTIRDHHQWFGHYHTAGVPGRNEIDETQELFYPAIMKTIFETGFTGFVAQEFIPSGETNENKIEALRKAIQICDI